MELVGKKLEEAIEAIKSGKGYGDIIFCVYCKRVHNGGNSCPLCQSGWSGTLHIPPKNWR